MRSIRTVHLWGLGIALALIVGFALPAQAAEIIQVDLAVSEEVAVVCSPPAMVATQEIAAYYTDTSTTLATMAISVSTLKWTTAQETAFQQRASAVTPTKMYTSAISGSMEHTATMAIAKDTATAEASAVMMTPYATTTVTFAFQKSADAHPLRHTAAHPLLC